MEQDVTLTLSSYVGESLSFPSDHISIDETFVIVFPGLSLFATKFAKCQEFLLVATFIISHFISDD